MEKFIQNFLEKNPDDEGKTRFMKLESNQRVMPIKVEDTTPLCKKPPLKMIFILFQR
jgi:hypothetical protein